MCVCVCVCVCVFQKRPTVCKDLLRTVDTEIKVPTVENPELTDDVPLKPGAGQNIYNHACFAHCPEFLSGPNFCLPSPFTFILFQILTLLIVASDLSKFPWGVPMSTQTCVIVH